MVKRGEGIFSKFRGEFGPWMKLCHWRDTCVILVRYWRDTGLTDRSQILYSFVMIRFNTFYFIKLFVVMLIRCFTLIV